MERKYTGVRYIEAEAVPANEWMVQGTKYETAEQAKFAAAKLWSSCNNSGVVVKQLKDGSYTLFWWRYITNA